MERKLATLQRIKELRPIEGADRIELAFIQGWQVVVQKGTHKVGDLVVFFEIDSLIPEGVPWGEFLGERRRIKTMKLRGALSQGLIIPLSDVLVEGFDISKSLGVEKWLSPAEKAELNASGWGNSGGLMLPYFYDVPKTDETRLQVAPEVLDELKVVNGFYITEKLDGMSVTAYYDPDKDELRYASRNHEIAKGALHGVGIKIDKYMTTHAIADALKAFPNLVFQGELIGPDIQGNRYGLSEVEWRIYQVYDRNEHRYVSVFDALRLCAEAGLQFVPFVVPQNLELTVDRLVQIATEVGGEGIVVRPTVETQSAIYGGRLSFKVINPEWLLKYDKDEENVSI